MTIIEVKDDLETVRREFSEIMEKSKLYTVAPIPVLLLCRSQVVLEDFYEIFDEYCCLFPFLVSQLIFLLIF